MGWRIDEDDVGNGGENSDVFVSDSVAVAKYAVAVAVMYSAAETVGRSVVNERLPEESVDSVSTPTTRRPSPSAVGLA